jgi:C-terminal processing protease CtpA/Prc
MAPPIAGFSKHPTLAMRRFFLAGLTSVTLCNAVLASETEDAIKLYEAGEFREAKDKFQAVLNETMRDSRSAYYYALSLNSAGHTPQAVVVCRQIIARFPNTDAAKQAKVAIDRWAHFNAVAKASESARALALASRTNRPIDPKLGIIGLKFEMEGRDFPMVRLVFPDTPAANVLRVNDEITAVDGVTTRNLTKEQIYDLIVGVPETAVAITVKRNDEFTTHSLKRLSALKFSKLHPEIWRDYERN